MGRRIRWLGVVMVACLGLVIVQLVNIQLVKAKSLATSQYNPRIAVERYVNPRGEILASDGTLLAKSVPTPASTNRTDYPYNYVRQYPQGPLYADITGYDSALTGAQTDIENYYDSYLSAHSQSAQTLSQLLFREKLPTTTDNVSLTVEPKLQQVAEQALAAVPGKNDGAVVVLDPKTGAVLAMYSSPTYDPNTLVSTSLAADNFSYTGYTTKDGEGFYPLRSLATSRVLRTGFDDEGRHVDGGVQPQAVADRLRLSRGAVPEVHGLEPAAVQRRLVAGELVAVRRDDGADAARIVRPRLRRARDPGRRVHAAPAGRVVRHQLGPADRPAPARPAAGRRGDRVETGVDTPELPGAPGVRAIGQETIYDTALQNAMVAAGIANGGVVMTPHLMSSIHDSTGALVKTYTPTPLPRSASAASAQAVTNLMESVPISGTASGVGFPSYLCAAVKTGTAQTGLSTNHDWMIGFAPANNPQIAVAVVVPYQYIGTDGAQIAGPIVKAIMQAALPPGSVQQPCTVAMPPSSDFGH